MADAKKTDPRDTISGAELAVRCQRAVESLDGLEELLQPYIDLWSEICKQRQAEQPYAAKLGFWDYDGPHDRVDYHIRWDYSDMGSLHFEGTDPDHDVHSWSLPISFLSEYEERAREMAEKKVEAARREAVRRHQAEEAEKAHQRRLRFAQYQVLKREFEGKDQ